MPPACRWPMPPTAPIAITDLAHTIQLAVAPVFLLAGIGGFLNVMAGRLSRVVDRVRRLSADSTAADDPHHATQVAELRLLNRRIGLVNTAILLCTASAVMICLVVAGLFVADLARLGFARTMAVGFILAMLLLIGGLCYFLVEVRIAARMVYVEEAVLERQARKRWLD